MKKPKVSVAIATYNEEENIADCLLSVSQLSDEVVIADGKSTDRTRELAEKNGARVITTTNKAMFHINKNLAIDNSRGEWILLLDADERVTEELTKAIKLKIKSNPPENGFYINRSNWFLGGFLEKGGAYPDSVVRLFRKGKGRLPEVDVHEQMAIDGQIGSITEDIIHMADPSFERYLKRAVRYTDRTAHNFEKSSTPVNIVTVIFYMLIKPTLTFFSLYLRHKGYQDGFRGFIWALFSGAHHYYAFVKYWHKKNS